MKQIIERLKRATDALDVFTALKHGDDRIYKAYGEIKIAIKELQLPRRETPEQYKARTGKEWPDDWAVYMRMQHVDGTWSAWRAMAYDEAQCNLHTTQIVCATEAGTPPENWMPEEENK